MPQSIPRWLKLATLLLVPLLLYAVLAERASWRPRILTYSDPVLDVAYSPDGRWLSCATTNQLELREAHSLRVVWQHHINASVTDLSHVRLRFSPDNARLVFLDGTTIHSFNLRTHQLERALDLPRRLERILGLTTRVALTQLAFDASGSDLFIGGLQYIAQPGEDDSMFFCFLLHWNLQTGQCQRASLPTGEPLLDLSGASQTYVLLVRDDAGQQLPIRDCVTNRKLSMIHLPSSPELHNALFTPDGKALVTVSDASLILWNSHTGRQIKTIVAFKNAASPANYPTPVTAQAFDANSQITAIGDLMGHIYLWNVKSGRLERILTSQRSGIEALAFAPNGATLTVACYGKALQLWRIK